MRFIDELMKDVLDIANLRSKTCSIEYEHVVNPRYHPAKMTVHASTHLGQMYELHRTLTPVSGNTSKASASPLTPFSAAIAVLEGCIEKMMVTDSTSESSDSDSLNNEDRSDTIRDCVSVLDLDFEESTPDFVKEGLHLSLNAAVPISLTTPLPTRA